MSFKGPHWASTIPNGVAAIPGTADYTCNSGCVGLYVGTAGDVKVDMETVDAVVIKNVVAGAILPGRFTKVYDTGTTATDGTIAEFFWIMPSV